MKISKRFESKDWGGFQGFGDSATSILIEARVDVHTVIVSKFANKKEFERYNPDSSGPEIYGLVITWTEEQKPSILQRMHSVFLDEFANTGREPGRFYLGQREHGEFLREITTASGIALPRFHGREVISVCRDTFLAVGP